MFETFRPKQKDIWYVVGNWDLKSHKANKKQISNQIVQQTIHLLKN